MSYPSFEFGQYRLEPAQRKLSRNGEVLPVGGRAFDILIVLASASGRIVTKGELMAKVWPNVIVEENNLHVQMAALRRVLGSELDGTSPLMTIRGHGYQLVGLRDNRSLALAERDSASPAVAVLSFDEFGQSPTPYFAEGVVEELITTLSQMSAVAVVAHSSSISFRGSKRNPCEIGAALGARYAVKGSVRYSEDGMTILVELSDVRTRTNLWADRFTVERPDLLEIEQQVARRIAGSVAPRVEAAEIARVRRKPTANLEAHDSWLRALSEFHIRTEESIERAIELSNRAVVLDPEFAVPLGLKACCYMLRRINGWNSDPGETQMALCSARLAAQKGEADPRALAFAGMVIAQMSAEPAAGLALVDRALFISPHLTIALIASGWIRTICGEFDIALTHLSKAERLSPLDPFMTTIRSAKAAAHFFKQEYSDAAHEASCVIYERPNFLPALRILAAAQAEIGNQSEAARSIARILEQDPALSVRTLKDRLPPYPEDSFHALRDALEKAGLPD